MKTYAESGERVTLTVAAGCAVGDPLIIGGLNCVAETLAAAGADATLRTEGVYWLSVKGVDDAGNSAVAPGDQIYFVTADTPKLSKKESGNFFGWALDSIYAAATTTIRVLLGGAGVGLLDTPALVSPALVFGVASHDYLAGAADWVFTSAAIAAVGTITISGGMSAVGEKFVIDTQEFTFKTLRSGLLKGEVTLGATAAACCTNIIAAVNADIPSVTASQGAGTTVVITVNAPGTGGNALVFTEAAAHFAMDGSGVLGGTTAGVAAATSTATVIRATNASGNVNMIAVPTNGKPYWVCNATGHTLTIKPAAQTGITVASAKTALVIGNGTDFVRATGDA